MRMVITGDITVTLQDEFEWLERLFAERENDPEGLKNFFHFLPPPDISADNSSYAKLIRKHNLDDFALRLFFVTATSAVVFPNLFSRINKNIINSSPYAFRQNANSPYILPSVETVLYLLSGNNLASRMKNLSLFRNTESFFSPVVLQRNEVLPGEPPESTVLCITSELADRILLGKKRAPKFSRDFPAKSMYTKAEWKNLILKPGTAAELGLLKIWLKQKQALDEYPVMQRNVRPGYKALFYGPPGTGKSMAAGLLGKETGMDVYRIDLSMVVSKYIGETEKNLAVVFDRLESQETILFFDEADALFGKRTQTRDAHDRYANQEISFLLQRIEDYDGLVILATNLKNNLDDAFIRRFQSVVHFSFPAAPERLLLWQQAFPSKLPHGEDVNLLEIANRYELSGAQIMNIVYYCTLITLEKKQPFISMNDLRTGMARELAKEGRTL